MNRLKAPMTVSILLLTITLTGCPPRPPVKAVATFIVEGESTTARLTCAPGCRATFERIEITKNGQVIGTIPTLTCNPGQPQATINVQLSDTGRNDLKGVVTVECSDTDQNGDNCDVNIPANQVPWGVDLLSNGHCRVIGQ